MAVSWGERGEVALVWREKLTLRSSEGRRRGGGRLHNKLLRAFSISVKVWHPLEIYVTFSSKVLMTMIFPRTNFSSLTMQTPRKTKISLLIAVDRSTFKDEMDDSECLAEFRLHKNDVPVLLEALQLPQSFTRQLGTICDGTLCKH